MKFCGIMLKLMLIIVASLEINDSKLASEIKSCKHYTGIFFIQKKDLDSEYRGLGKKEIKRKCCFILTNFDDSCFL